MFRRLGLLTILSILSLGVFCKNANTQSLITNNDVLELTKAGISPDIIVAKIKASHCQFDTSAAQLKSLKAAGISDQVILAMVEAPVSRDAEMRKAEAPGLYVEVLKERELLYSACSDCQFFLMAQVNSETGKVTDDWWTTNQRNWMERRAKDMVNGKKPPVKLLPTAHRENADYVMFWTSAQGFRPYVVYVPQTEVSTGNVSGVSTTTSGTRPPSLVPLGGL
jgi:hypothetical protein